MRTKIKILIIALTLFTFYKADGQTTDAYIGFSPYSLFGVGDLLNQGSANTLSMGGISTGVRDVRYINFINPAAVTAREQQSFMMDFGINVDNNYYASKTSDGTLAKTANNIFNMHHIVMSFPIYRNSAFKFGIQQYSGSGYKFLTYEPNDEIVSQVGDVKYSRIGQGGIYQAFVGAGVTLFKRLSLGVDGQYYFGTINRYSNLIFNSNTAYNSVYSGWTFTPRGFSAKAGLQYEQPIGNQYSVVLGATYQLGTKMGGEATRYAYTTINSEQDTITNNVTKIDFMDLPEEISVGFSVSKRDQWLIGFDYVRSDWRSTKMQATPGVAFSPALSQKFKVGFELTPNRYDVRYFMNRITYRAGIYYDQSYISIGGHQITAEGITLGCGIPVFRYYNAIALGLDFGRRGTLEDNLVRENYFKINVSFNLHDIWFIKTLYQ